MWLSPLSSLRDLAGHIKFIVFCEYECNPFLFFCFEGLAECELRDISGNTLAA